MQQGAHRLPGCGVSSRRAQPSAWIRPLAGLTAPGRRDTNRTGVQADPDIPIPWVIATRALSQAVFDHDEPGPAHHRLQVPLGIKLQHALRHGVADVAADGLQRLAIGLHHQIAVGPGALQ